MRTGAGRSRRWSDALSDRLLRSLCDGRALDHVRRQQAPRRCAAWHAQARRRRGLARAEVGDHHSVALLLALSRKRGLLPYRRARQHEGDRVRAGLFLRKHTTDPTPALNTVTRRGTVPPVAACSHPRAWVVVLRQQRIEVLLAVEDAPQRVAHRGPRLDAEVLARGDDRERVRRHSAQSAHGRRTTKLCDREPAFVGPSPRDC